MILPETTTKQADARTTTFGILFPGASTHDREALGFERWQVDLQTTIETLHDIHVFRSFRIFESGSWNHYFTVPIVLNLFGVTCRWRTADLLCDDWSYQGTPMQSLYFGALFLFGLLHTDGRFGNF